MGNFILFKHTHTHTAHKKDWFVAWLNMIQLVLLCPSGNFIVLLQSQINQSHSAHLKLMFLWKILWFNGFRETKKKEKFSNNFPREIFFPFFCCCCCLDFSSIKIKEENLYILLYGTIRNHIRQSLQHTKKM